MKWVQRTDRSVWGEDCSFQELPQQMPGGKGGDRRQARRGGSLLGSVSTLGRSLSTGAQEAPMEKTSPHDCPHSVRIGVFRPMVNGDTLQTVLRPCPCLRPAAEKSGVLEIPLGAFLKEVP